MRQPQHLHQDLSKILQRRLEIITYEYLWNLKIRHKQMKASSIVTEYFTNDEVEFIPRMQGCFNIENSKSLIYKYNAILVGVY